VSTASRVPETYELTGDDARETLMATGRRQLLVDSFVRLRAADGTSHSRSLAFMASLMIVQGLVVVLGLATVLGNSGLSATVADTIGAGVPGPASDVLREAIGQARRVGRQEAWTPLIIGLLGVLITSTVAMGQVERGLNRIYGVERDRPAKLKYARAFVLGLIVVTSFGTAFVLIGLGRGTSAGWGADARTAWLVLRWPISLALVAAALGVLLRFSPNRHQPGRAWLAFGAGVAVLLWVASTALLSVVFALASTFPRTYGPLAGVVALLLWTYVSTLVAFYGVAIAAQLEANRAAAHGRLAPVQDDVRPEPALAGTNENRGMVTASHHPHS
jgi:YihY family inner membrane protein